MGQQLSGGINEMPGVRGVGRAGDGAGGAPAASPAPGRHPGGGGGAAGQGRGMREGEAEAGRRPRRARPSQPRLRPHPLRIVRPAGSRAAPCAALRALRAAPAT